MDWSDLPPLSMLRAFEAAARLGGFSAAARELNVTPAAIGQQVRGLEARLGASLMRRDGRGLSLTPEGRRLAERLGAGMETIRAALAAFVRQAAEGPVRVTTTIGFSSGWLMPRLGAFRAAHPGVELMLNPTNTRVDLVRADYDLAIRYGVGPWPGLESEPLLASPGVVVAAPALLAGRTVRRPGDLAALPWVRQVDDDEWSIWLARNGVDTASQRAVLHLPPDLALQAIRDGQGVGMTSLLYVEADLRAGRLALLFDMGEDEGCAYHLVRRPGPLRPGADAFARWLRRTARDG